MQVGCLGDIIFQVSDSLVQTLNNAQWNGSARYAAHQRHLQDALTEFCGLEPDTFSFDMVLSAFLGVNPQTEINKIWKYERSGEAVSLVIGSKAYGKYRWSIVSHKAKMQHYDNEGNLLQATVSVSLQEYLQQ
ncbi:MAG: phage tail protein [Firmicutes bacterium]|nr:phage tail protein [Bacillota bacterium]